MALNAKRPRGNPGTPRPTAGPSLTPAGIDALLARLERHIARLEKAATRDATAIRLLRLRLLLLTGRLAAMDTTD